jgi:hypothetical protein
MADEAETQEVETHEIENEEDQQHEEAEGQESSEQEEQPSAEEDEEETIIGFGDEEEEESSEDDTPTITRLRERNRDQTKTIREQAREIAELRQAGAAPKSIEVGPKPTLESCEYDDEKFETELDAWKSRKAEAEAEAEKATEQTRRAMDSYNRDLEAYAARKASIGVPDYEEAEERVVAALSIEQQTVALQAAKDPAALVVALGRSPERLAELAKIDNPWKLAAEIARMEGAVKVVKRKKAPALDRSQRGSASVSTPDANTELERLEKEADRTGNRTALIAYKRSLKAKEGK